MDPKKNFFYGLFVVACICLTIYLVVLPAAERAPCVYPEPHTTRDEASLKAVSTANESTANEVVKISGNKQSYIFSFKYYEQQTQATKNFFGLQCLASTFGMKVVEPFVYRSSISFPFQELARGSELLRFGDLMDMDLWNQQTTETYHFPPVAKWEEFLNEAPRDVVIVCIKYRNPPKIRIPIPGHDYRLGCKDACFEAFNTSLEFLKGHRFRLTKKVCVNFVDYAGSVTPGTFLKDILGNGENGGNERNGVTVLFNEFRGFFGLYRAQILSPCGIISGIKNISVLPSQRLVREASYYSTKYLGSRPYASILVRVERIVLHNHRNISECGEEVLSILQALIKDRHIEDYFLGMDVGKFGSSGSVLNNLQPQGETIFNQIYRDKWSFRDWENSFTQTSSNINPAYIANLQRTIAAKGACMLMVGDGGFQGQARQLYSKYHPDPRSWCVYKVCLPK